MSAVAQSYLPEPEVELLTLRNPRFSPGNPSEPLGTHSAPFSETRRQIWGRKRKYHWGGSNPEPLASQPHALTTGLPRLTHNKIGKFDYLCYNRKETHKKSLARTKVQSNCLFV